MIEIIFWLIIPPVAATIIGRTTIDDIRSLVPSTPRAETTIEPHDDCRTVRLYGYMGNVDINRIPPEQRCPHKP